MRSLKRLLILIISILFTVSLCACKKDLTQVGRQEASEDNTSNNIDKTSSYDTSSDNTYSISSHELVCEDDWIFEESYYYQDGTLYYASEKEGATDQIFTIHSYNIYDGSDTVLFTFTEEKYQIGRASCRERVLRLL